MNSITFKANLVDATTIQQRGFCLSWKPVSASIVELDKKNKYDIDALKKTSENWKQKGGQYSSDILFHIKHYPRYYQGEINHFYALTTQKQNFESLNSEEILGLMMFQEKNNMPEGEICYLEVNPSTSKSKNLIQKYKQVGKSLVEFIKSKFSDREIWLFADYKARNFYKKVGFEEYINAPSLFFWRAIK